MVFDIKLLRVFMARWSHRSPWRLLHMYFRIFPHTFATWWGLGRESSFRKIYGGEVNLCVPNFQISIEFSQ